MSSVSEIRGAISRLVRRVLLMGRGNSVWLRRNRDRHRQRALARLGAEQKEGGFLYPLVARVLRSYVTSYVTQARYDHSRRLRLPRSRGWNPGGYVYAFQTHTLKRKTPSGHCRGFFALRNR